ncbi:hypothetical protein [Sphingomonas faeni]|uniref:hypothetical protein n=1 Tax=Sphingomonas faeni TaxID=185950 RepID=UPI00241356F5|nr:hypothetical protein [Sphingomonas faeni]
MTLSTVPYALVVDDDPLIMMDTTGILEDAGFRFYEAMDGDEAKRLSHQLGKHRTAVF